MTDEEDLAPIEERIARGIQLFREGFRQTSRKYRGVSRRTVHLELDDATFNSFREEAKRAAENNVQCSSFTFEVACCPSKDNSRDVLVENYVFETMRKNRDSGVTRRSVHHVDVGSRSDHLVYVRIHTSTIFKVIACVSYSGC